MNNNKNLARNQVKEGFDPLLQIKNEEKKKKVKTNENPLEKNNNNTAKNNSNSFVSSTNDDTKIALGGESNSDKKVMDTLFSEQNMFKENKNDRVKNFFGEENLANEKSQNNNNNNIRINSATTNSSNSNLYSATVNNNNININNSLLNSKGNNYFVNSNAHGFNSYNVNFKNNFFLDREFISKTFDINKPETIIDYDEAYFRSEDNNSIGIIAMTDYKMMFKFKDEYMFKKLNYHEDYFKLPFFQIAKIEKISDKKNQSNYTLEITTKDLRTMRFIILSDQMKFFADLNNYVFQKDHSQIFNFVFKYRSSQDPNAEEGWSIFEPKREFARQGLDFKDASVKLKESNLNKNFGLCATYPEYLVFPSIISDQDLREASSYRTKNRLPTLSYYYNPQQGKKVFGTLWRSSQNKTGLTQSRSAQDEKLLKCIGELGNKLVIYDARPYLAALANRIKGGGFENADHYNCQVNFCEIENIHNVRNSLNKMWGLANSNKINENKKFWSTVESSSWYEYVHLFLKYSTEIAQHLRKLNSVLIHCSDGWDRSSQLLATSQLLVDPYFRTLRGFMLLVEKEFLSFGHQFALRIGISQKDSHNEDQRSPIFLQWLDTIHQLLHQFPEAFEFNMDFLLNLAFHYNSCLYGTFMFNCECERNEKKAKLKTTSIWTDVIKHQNRYLNSSYAPVEVIFPNSSPYKMRFWEEFFFRFNTSVERGAPTAKGGFYTGIGVNQAFAGSAGFDSVSVANSYISNSNGNSVGAGNFSVVRGENAKGAEADEDENRIIQGEKGDLDVKKPIVDNSYSWSENKIDNEEKQEANSNPNLLAQGEENLNPDDKEYFNESQHLNETNKKSNNEFTINEAISESINFENEEKRKSEKGNNSEVEVESALLELIVKLSNKNIIYDMDLSEETLNTINKFKAD